MNILSEKIWDDLDLPDWRGRFFIECYMESLSVRTPHFHQAKLLGIIELAEEVERNIKIYEDNDKGKSYLASSLKELGTALKSDPIATTILSDAIPYFNECVKKISTEKIPRSLIIQLGVICRRIINSKQLYQDVLTQKLTTALFEDTDLTKKDTLTREINSLTRRYVTSLLNAGYSPTYLYNKSELLTRKTGYNGRSFNEQIIYFLNSLDRNPTNFTIYFGIQTNKKDTLRTYACANTVEVISSIPEKHPAATTQTLARFEADLYIKISSLAMDYVSAAQYACATLETELDFLKSLSSNTNITLHTSCYADYETKGHAYRREVKINKLNTLLTYDQRSQQLFKHLQFDFRTSLAPNAVKKIEGVLQNIRQAKESARLEQKLLSLWISLESLSYSGDDKSIISSVLNLFPKLYTLESIKQRVDYVKGLLKNYKTEIPESVIVRHQLQYRSFQEDIPSEVMYDLVACRNSASEICSAIKNSDLLYFRLYGLHKLLNSDSEIRAKLTSTKENIENHLYRIYLKRNNIIHVGHEDNLNHYIVNHLTEYVNTMLLFVIEAAQASKHITTPSLEDILLSSQLSVDKKLEDLKQGSIKSLNDLSPASLI
uniref:hypothetical protein n=1 Tax=Pseudomonas fulva TaxID=47880 RepID=UPI001F1A6238|nr:hypothetical protein [Pseudomonas fulva]